MYGKGLKTNFKLTAYTLTTETRYKQSIDVFKSAELIFRNVYIQCFIHHLYTKWEISRLPDIPNISGSELIVGS